MALEHDLEGTALMLGLRWPKMSLPAGLTTAHYNAASLYGYTVGKVVKMQGGGRTGVEITRKGGHPFALALDATVDQWLDVFRQLNNGMIAIPSPAYGRKARKVVR